jgi:segregation and condensation protein B
MVQQRGALCMIDDENIVKEDDASILDEGYDDSEESSSELKNSEALKTNENQTKDFPEKKEEQAFPEVKSNKSEPEENVQLSLYPSIQEDEEKQQAEKENRKHLEAVLEGLLFLTGDDGLTIEQASKTLEITGNETVSLFDDLQKYYTGDDRGFEIERYGNTYRFLSKATVHEAAKKLFQMDSSAKLSSAAMETLAIIAYKQPVTRVEIEEIRGVGADVMIRKLEARGLVEESGRSDAPGRPFLYSVTDAFMDAFQLMSLEELPDLPEFNRNEDGGEDIFDQDNEKNNN